MWSPPAQRHYRGHHMSSPCHPPPMVSQSRYTTGDTTCCPHSRPLLERPHMIPPVIPLRKTICQPPVISPWSPSPETPQGTPHGIPLLHPQGDHTSSPVIPLRKTTCCPPVIPPLGDHMSSPCHLPVQRHHRGPHGTPQWGHHRVHHMRHHTVGTTWGDNMGHHMGRPDGTSQWRPHGIPHWGDHMGRPHGETTLGRTQGETTWDTTLGCHMLRPHETPHWGHHMGHHTCVTGCICILPFSV